MTDLLPLTCPGCQAVTGHDRDKLPKTDAVWSAAPLLAATCNECGLVSLYDPELAGQPSGPSPETLELGKQSARRRLRTGVKL